MHAIEADDFARCGGDFYARGHIRAICGVLGQDAEPLIARYDADHGGSPEQAKPVPPIFDDDRIHDKGRRPTFTAAMVAAIVLVVAVIGFNLVMGRNGGGTPAQAATAGSRSQSIGPVIRPSLSATSGAAGAAGPSVGEVAAAPAGAVTVKLSAVRAASWLRITDANGRTLFSGDLAKGATRTWSDDRELRIVLGDAGAVRVWVNGKDVGKPGADGEVARLSYSAGE